MVKFLFLFMLAKSQILDQISQCEEMTLKIFKIFQGKAIVSWDRKGETIYIKVFENRCLKSY